MLMTFEQLYIYVDSDISLAVSTRMPYCPILTFEDDSTYKHAKDKSDCNSFLLAVLSKYNGSLVEGLSLCPYHELTTKYTLLTFDPSGIKIGL